MRFEETKVSRPSLALVLGLSDVQDWKGLWLAGRFMQASLTTGCPEVSSIEGSSAQVKLGFP